MSDSINPARVPRGVPTGGQFAATVRAEADSPGLTERSPDVAEDQYIEQAAAIATLADSIATGRLIGPRHAAVARLVDMVDTLQAWTEDDRSQRHALVPCAVCGTALAEGEPVGTTTKCRHGEAHTPTATLSSIAAEAGISVTTARLRCEGLSTDHLGNNTPLEDHEASMIRAAVRG